MKNIAIIPARSGSKGLKDKNIKELNGKPLIWYSVRAALESGMFDEVMVSTDSGHYAEIATECGAKVPFLRSDMMSTDTASSWGVVREVLENYKDRGRIFENVMLLQPTSPLRNVKDIQMAFKTFYENHADSVVSVCEVEHSPLWSNTLPDDDNLEGFIREEINKDRGRQKLPTYYRINGAIYLVKIRDYANLAFDIYNRHSYAYRMPQERSIDIDTELDFYMAEYLMHHFT